MGGAEQAIGVFLQTENARAVDGGISTHAFKHAHAIVQGMRQHMHLGIAPRNQFTVQPDNTITICHRHGYTLK